jgi:hypothetical protein
MTWFRRPGPSAPCRQGPAGPQDHGKWAAPVLSRRAGLPELLSDLGNTPPGYPGGPPAPLPARALTAITPKYISGGGVKLLAGTLYTALERLRSDGLIQVDREEVVDNRLRRYYRLTPDGEKRLAAEAARLHSHATVALRRLNPNLAGGAA